MVPVTKEERNDAMGVLRKTTWTKVYHRAREGEVTPPALVTYYKRPWIFHREGTCNSNETLSERRWVENKNLLILNMLFVQLEFEWLSTEYVQ